MHSKIQRKDKSKARKKLNQRIRDFNARFLFSLREGED